MTKRPPKSPTLSDQGRQARDDREARLARALRENLRKRKAQARQRTLHDPGENAGGAPDDSQGGEA
jgi:hypothetical protein